jgi:hypothetical protein
LLKGSKITDSSGFLKIILKLLQFQYLSWFIFSTFLVNLEVTSSIIMLQIQYYMYHHHFITKKRGLLAPYGYWTNTKVFMIEQEILRLSFCYRLGLSLHMRTIQSSYLALQQLYPKGSSRVEKNFCYGFEGLVYIPVSSKPDHYFNRQLIRPWECTKGFLRFSPTLCNYSRSPLTWYL